MFPSAVVHLKCESVTEPVFIFRAIMQLEKRLWGIALKEGFVFHGNCQKTSLYSTEYWVAADVRSDFSINTEAGDREKDT